MKNNEEFMKEEPTYMTNILENNSRNIENIREINNQITGILERLGIDYSDTLVEDCNIKTDLKEDCNIKTDLKEGAIRDMIVLYNNMHNEIIDLGNKISIIERFV